MQKHMCTHAGFQCKGGYTLATPDGLAAVNKALAGLGAGRAEELVRVGVHEDIQVSGHSPVKR